MPKRLFSNRPVRTIFRTFLFGVGVGVCVCACVSIAQGKNSVSADAPERSLYLYKCGTCHSPFPAHSYTASQWPGIVEDMADEAGLSDEETAAILRFLKGRN